MGMYLDLAAYRDKRICVALSGGGDSVALLHYLRANGGAFGISLCAAHCEHGIRGEPSLRDAGFCARLCEGWGIPLFSFSADCPRLAQEQRKSLETAARDFRYACFDGILREGKADCVATAHHGGDNAETVLFRLCRGTSLTGMGGIAEREGYIRPLLGVSKAEIEGYLSENGLEYCTDETNGDGDITRNAIRLRVLPVLKEAVPGAAESINRFSALCREDDALLYRLSEGYAEELRDGTFAVSLGAEPPLFRRACLSVLRKMGVEKDYTARHLEALAALKDAKNGDRLSMPRGITAIREYGKVVFYRERGVEEAGEIPFALGEFSLGGIRFSVGTEGAGERPGCLRAAREKISGDAVFRRRRPGDVITPFGGGTKKLKDFLIARKVPQRLRGELVLLASGKDVLAVLGVEISEKVRIGQGDTPVFLCLKS